jgi:hypothetical protein
MQNQENKNVVPITDMGIERKWEEERKDKLQEDVHDNKEYIVR